MSKPPDEPDKSARPRKRRHPPVRVERFVGDWDDVVWLKPAKPLPPEEEPLPPPSTDEP